MASASSDGRTTDLVTAQSQPSGENKINDELDDPKRASLPPWKNLEGKQPVDPRPLPASDIPNLASSDSREPDRDNDRSDDGALASPGGIENLPPLRSLAEPTWCGVTPPAPPDTIGPSN